MSQSLSTNRLRFRDTRMFTLSHLLLIPSPTLDHTPVEAAGATSVPTKMMNAEDFSTHTVKLKREEERVVDTETLATVASSPHTDTDPALALTTTLIPGLTTIIANHPKTLASTSRVDTGFYSTPTILPKKTLPLKKATSAQSSSPTTLLRRELSMSQKPTLLMLRFQELRSIRKSTMRMLPTQELSTTKSQNTLSIKFQELTTEKKISMSSRRSQFLLMLKFQELASRLRPSKSLTKSQESSMTKFPVMSTTRDQEPTLTPSHTKSPERCPSLEMSQSQELRSCRSHTSILTTSVEPSILRMFSTIVTMTKTSTMAFTELI